MKCKELRNTGKNGYYDFAIAEAEKEYTDGAAAIDAELAKEKLNKKYYV